MWPKPSIFGPPVGGPRGYCPRFAKSTWEIIAKPRAKFHADVSQHLQEIRNRQTTKMNSKLLYGGK